MCPNRKLQLGQWGQLAISILDFKLVSPLPIKVPVVYKPILEFQQLCTQLAPLLRSKSCRFSLGFSEPTMLDFRRDETRKARLGPRSRCEPTVESTATVMPVGGSLARRASAGTCPAPLARPIRSKTPV